MNPFVDQSNYKVLEGPKYALKTKTETAIKNRLVMGIETLLDIISIILQNKRERNQNSLNKQNANTTPPLVKGIWPLKPSQ